MSYSLFIASYSYSGIFLAGQEKVATSKNRMCTLLYVHVPYS